MPETRENKPDTAPGVAQYFEADRATDIESDNNGAQYRENHEQQGFQADSPGKTIRFESSRIAQPNDKQNPPKVWLSAETSANLCAIPLRTFQDRTSKGSGVLTAGAVGYGAGAWVNDKYIQGTDIGDKIGEAVARALAAFGHEDAKRALEINLSIDGQQIAAVVNSVNGQQARRS